MEPNDGLCAIFRLYRRVDQKPFTTGPPETITSEQAPLRYSSQQAAGAVSFRVPLRCDARAAHSVARSRLRGIAITTRAAHAQGGTPIRQENSKHMCASRSN
jgi:hypothetical protein